MATPDWNNIDQFEKSFPAYNCAFLDILGYKEKAIAFFDNKFNLYGRICRAYRTAATILNLTSSVVDSSGLRVEVFSDSIIFTQPNSAPGVGILLLLTCQFSSLLSIEGLFVRGGISRGRHYRARTEQGLEFLASEALQKAYALEQTAKFPRVLVDRELVDEMPEEERTFVLSDGNEFMVDFANYIIGRDGNNCENVFSEMTDIQSEMRNQTNEGVIVKLQWLLDYYYWTIATNPKWDSQPFQIFPSIVPRQFSRL